MPSPHRRIRKLAQELVELSQKTYNTVKARVTAGKVSPIHEIKAQVALSTTQVQYQQADNNLKAAYRQTGCVLGKSRVALQFERVGGKPVPGRAGSAL